MNSAAALSLNVLTLPGIDPALLDDPPKRFIPPTIEECKLFGSGIGLPEPESIKFHCYYESNGWKVGKHVMKKWKAAMSGWRVRWEERCGNRNEGLSNCQRFIHQKELERLIERMRVISKTYDEHRSWSKEDREEWKKLKERREELRKLLCVIV